MDLLGPAMIDLNALPRWNCWHPLENHTRGTDSERLAHSELDLDPGKQRIAWGDVDLTHGLRTHEVKQAAHVQSLAQEEPSGINFPIEQRIDTA